MFILCSSSPASLNLFVHDPWRDGWTHDIDSPNLVAVNFGNQQSSALL